MLTPRLHGVKTTQGLGGGARRALRESASVIGLIAVAGNADATAFPLNQRVLVNDFDGLVAKAGDTGTLAPAMEAIADQTRPTGVIVRVDQGATAAETEANVVAGIRLLRASQGQFNLRPSIIGAPGLDTQLATVELAATAARLRGMAYAGCDVADTIAEAAAYRGQFGQRELMLFYPGFTRAGGSAATIARLLGLRAQIDEEQGWHKTISNVTVNGVDGLSADVTWDPEDADTDAGLLNGAQVNALVNDDGYRAWGHYTCSADPEYLFESEVRASQVVRDMAARGRLRSIAKPFHPQLARDLVEELNVEGGDLVNQGRLLGFEAYLDVTRTDAANLKLGRGVIAYDWTAVPPLDQLELVQTKTDRFYFNFAQRAA